MRILLLSDANSIHTKRWVRSLSEKGISIFLFSRDACRDNFYDSLSCVQVYGFTTLENAKGRVHQGALKKALHYFPLLIRLRKAIREFKPDIVHAHYACIYGIYGSLCGFHPYVLSVWGSDIYDFPEESGFNKKLIQFVLRKADVLLSTSYAMADQTRKYTSKAIEVTPFGVDTGLFFPHEKKPHPDGGLVIGTVKTLLPKYGIDTLINAFSILKQNNPDKKIELVIVGEGPDRKELEKQVDSLGLTEHVTFTGKIDNTKIPRYINSFDIFTALSRLDSESFGVAAVEAMACACPVVVSDVDGFKEVVVDNETGFIVPRNNAIAAAKKMQRLIDNPDLRTELGRNGHKRVETLYDWNDNVNRMINIYRNI